MPGAHPAFQQPLGLRDTIMWAFVYVGIRAILEQIAIVVLRTPDSIDDVTATMILAIASMLTVFFVVRRHNPEGSLRDMIGLVRPHWPTLVLAAFIGCLLALPIERLLSFAWDHWLSNADKTKDIQAASLLRPSLRVAETFADKIVSPLFESLVFLGVLYNGLEQSVGRNEALGTVFGVQLLLGIFELFAAAANLAPAKYAVAMLIVTLVPLIYALLIRRRSGSFAHCLAFLVGLGAMRVYLQYRENGTFDSLATRSPELFSRTVMFESLAMSVLLLLVLWAVAPAPNEDPS
jgi:hypothetical protein